MFLKILENHDTKELRQGPENHAVGITVSFSSPLKAMAGFSPSDPQSSLGTQCYAPASAPSTASCLELSTLPNTAAHFVSLCSCL